LNSETVRGLAKATDSKRFAFDAYRRLLEMYGDVVLGIPHDAFEKSLEGLKSVTGKDKDTDFTSDDLEKLCKMYKKVYDDHNEEFPEDPYDQLKVSCYPGNVRCYWPSWASSYCMLFDFYYSLGMHQGCLRVIELQ
jgi:phosphoenolpyruvate synthase/pyruvate phosphate dikinase